MEFLEFLENNSLATWVAESPSIFAYPTLLAVHTYGMAFMVGTSTAIALRLLGCAAGVPLAPLRKFFPVIWLGFALSALSGALLLMIDARLFLTMPAFYIKILAIVAAVTMMRLLRTRVFGDRGSVDTGPLPRKHRVLAGGVLFCWAVAIGAGRVTAYEPSTGLKTALAVLILTAVFFVGRYVALRIWGAKATA